MPYGPQSNKPHRFHIRNWRMKERLTVREMAAKMGLPYSSVKWWEDGGTQPLKPDIRKKFADLTGLSDEQIEEIGTGE